MDNVRKGTGTQLLQVSCGQKELVITLPLGDLKQSSDAVQPGPLYPANQPASSTLTYKKSKAHQNMDDLEKNKLHQAETNLGTRETDSYQMEVQESLITKTTSFA